MLIFLRIGYKYTRGLNIMNAHQVNNKYIRPLSLISTIKRKGRSERSGFALISVIVIMPLLAIMAVAILNLSSVEARTNKSSSYRVEAQANARVALMKAIGQLQLLSGPDTRVTASARLLDESNVAVTGVWRSWEGMTLDSDGRPIAPDYALKYATGDPSDIPADADGDGRFLGWLGSVSEMQSVSDLSDFSKSASGDYVQVLGEGSVDDSDDYVYIKPTYINQSEGSIAWWTSGLNRKAMVNARLDEEPNSVVGWQEQARANGRVDAESFGIGAVDTRPVGANVPSLNSLKLVANTAEIKKFHDLTTYSRGLMTNTARGGWRRDISLLSEQFDDLPDTGLPSLMMEPGKVQTFSKAILTGSAHRPNPLLYPWASYRSLNGQAWGQVPPICSWTAMVNYALQYRDLTSSNASKTSMDSSLDSISGVDRYNFQEKTRRAPQLARLQWIMSLCSKEETTGVNAGKYKAGLQLAPVLTLWNPYNVELTISGYDMRITQDGILPLRFVFKVNTISTALTTMPQITEGEMQVQINSNVTLMPGESKTFSIASTTPIDGSGILPLVEGYNPLGGFKYYGINGGNEVHADGDASYSIESVSYSADNGTGVVGMYYDTYIIDASGGKKRVAHRMGYKADELAGGVVAYPDIVEALYPSLDISKAVGKLSDLSDPTGIEPFSTAIFAYRMASPISDDPIHAHLRTKGMVSANPLTYYSEVGNQDNGSKPDTMIGTGVFHPINSAYDLAFLDAAEFNLPQVDPSTNAGYIVTGLSANNGLTRCIISELPTRPLQSLADLQHFDARNNNPIPPFQYNMIGNGSAHPLFEPNEATVTENTVNVGMVNDDTYYLNHLLFDDWFVSSIAPDLRDFSSGEDRDYETVYADHVSGDQPLPNRFYQPSKDASITDVDTEEIDGRYTYDTIASKLEVDGMFNINSVSEDAWIALLKQSRDAEVPYLDGSGGTTLSNSSADTYPYPRTSIAGDQDVDSSSTISNSLNSDAVALAGYPALTNTQVEALAVQIVNEIRVRGPFLSLSEFVNRRLTDDKDLAIAGTIQKALDNLAAMGNVSSNPFSDIQQLVPDVTTLPPGESDYKFPEAFYGSTAFGVPGWVRQADILKPLAPIITARDDSFIIRAYGDVRDPLDPDKVLAKAWCEAIVQRTAEYVDPVDESIVNPHSVEMTSETNNKYGRRYILVSFRWLSEGEI